MKFKLKKKITISIISLIITGCASDSASWMTDNGSSIDNKRISQLSIPGTNIANAYDVDKSNAKCRGEMLPQSYSTNAQVQQQITDESSEQAALFINALNTQDNDILTQLKHGTRYLDIQICYQDGETYTSNLYLTDKFSTITEQIVKFLEAHPEEIIIIDFDNNIRNEHGYMTGSDLATFHKDLQKTFGSAIIPKNKMYEPIGELKSQHYQIIILSSNAEFSQYPDVWDKDQVAVDAEAQSATIKKLSVIETALDPNTPIPINKLNIIPIYSDIQIDTLSEDMDGDDAEQSIIINYLQQNITNRPGIIASNKTFNAIIQNLIIRQDVNSKIVLPVESSTIFVSPTESMPHTLIESGIQHHLKIESMLAQPITLTPPIAESGNQISILPK